MKKLPIFLVQRSVLAAGLACSVPAFAQQPVQPGFPPETSAPPPEQGLRGHRGMMDPVQQLASMTRRYHLSADQQKQIKPILMDQQQRMQSLRLNSSLSADEKKANMQSIRRDCDARIEDVLDDDQKKQFQQDRQSMQENTQQRPKNDSSGGGEPPPQ